MQLNATSETLLETENQGDSPGKGNMLCHGVDSLRTEHINTATSQRIYQIAGNHAHLRLSASRIGIPPLPPCNIYKADVLVL